MATDRSDAQIHADMFTACMTSGTEDDLRRVCEAETRLLDDVPVLLARAERAEAAVQRVRALVGEWRGHERLCAADGRPGSAYLAVATSDCADELLAALDGTPDGEKP